MSLWWRLFPAFDTKPNYSNIIVPQAVSMSAAVSTGIKEWNKHVKYLHWPFYYGTDCNDNKKRKKIVKQVLFCFYKFVFILQGICGDYTHRVRKQYTQIHTPSLSSSSVQCITFHRSKCMFYKIRSESCNRRGQQSSSRSLGFGQLKGNQAFPTGLRGDSLLCTRAFFKNKSNHFQHHLKVQSSMASLLLRCQVNSKH